MLRPKFEAICRKIEPLLLNKERALQGKKGWKQTFEAQKLTTAEDPLLCQLHPPLPLHLLS